MSNNDTGLFGYSWRESYFAMAMIWIRGFSNLNRSTDSLPFDSSLDQRVQAEHFYRAADILLGTRISRPGFPPEIRWVPEGAFRHFRFRRYLTCRTTRQTCKSRRVTRWL